MYAFIPLKVLLQIRNKNVIVKMREIRYHGRVSENDCMEGMRR